jgi:L-ascorbate metabolism protein UlaG (beta-lactamase superfamily)
VGPSSRLCKAAKGALLTGEDAVIAVVARSDRAGWPDPMVQASRVPADADVVLVVTSHRLLIMEHLARGHVGEPHLGVGPHSLLELDVAQFNPVAAKIVIRYLDGSVTELTTLTVKAVPGLRAAFHHLLPKLDDLATR